MSRLGGIPMILIGAWLIVDRNNASRVWVRNAFSPVNPETGRIVRVIAGIAFIAGGLSMLAGSS